MQLNFTQLFTNVCLALEAGQVPMITSPPGLGKSSLGRLVAEANKLIYIDIRLSNYSVVTLNGFPHIDTEANASDFIPLKEIPIQGRDVLPKGYNGWLINFDELTACKGPLQAAAYKILLDKYVGSHKIHESVHMMACGNGLRDGAVSEPMSTALQSRMVHYQLMSHLDSFVKNAVKKGFHSKVIDFVTFRPELLNNFKPDHGDFTYACERSWEILSDIMHQITDLKDIPIYLATLEGSVGRAASQEFVGFLRVYDRLPSWNDIINAPTVTPVPQEPSVRIAMTDTFVRNVTTKNIGAAIEYIDRMPPENQLTLLRRVVAATPALASHPAIEALATKNAQKYTFM